MLPVCLKLGVPYEAFPHMNPRRLKPFIETYRAEKKAELERLDMVAWMSGLYTLEAIVSIFPKGKAYPEKPNIIQREEEKVNQTQLAAQNFLILADMWNRKFLAKGGDTHADGN